LKRLEEPESAAIDDKTPQKKKTQNMPRETQRGQCDVIRHETAYQVSSFHDRT
jgi:hypothetical protein